MPSTRIFYYSGDIDDNFKLKARESLMKAGWFPVDGYVRVMNCTGPTFDTCELVDQHDFFIVAQKDE
jgi:hypothetical protein